MRSDRLVYVAETSKERAEWRRFRRKNWNISGLLKRKKWPQCNRESSWQVRRSRFCQKEKEQSRLPKAPDHEGGESQGGRKRGDQSESMERKGKASKKNLPRTSRRKHERVSGRKSSPRLSAESWFHS